MKELITLLLIGIGLSMDAFSVSLGIGTYLNSKKKPLFLALLVGILHFIMPIIGRLLGTKIILFLNIEASSILGIVLLLIAFEMINELIKKEENELILNKISLFFIAIAVSLDSLGAGIGLSAVSDNIFLCSFLFMICSFTFTYIGLILGKYGSLYLGKYANIIGIIILILIGIKSLIE